MASSANLLLCRNKFHEVQHDVYDGAVEAELCDILAAVLPNWAVRSRYVTICVSEIYNNQKIIYSIKYI